MMPQREKVALDLNVPVTLQLSEKFPHGKMLEDRGYGPSVMYSTADDKVLFVDPDTSMRLTRLELAPGESFCISKTKNGKQPARLNVWLSPASEKMRAARETPEPPPSVVSQQLSDSLKNLAEGKPSATPRPTPVPPAIAARLDTHPPMPPTGLPPRNGSTPVKQSFAAAMGEFLLMAGRATREAEIKLWAEGGGVRFDSRDVAAIATTCFIAAERAGFLTWRPGEAE